MNDEKDKKAYTKFAFQEFGAGDGFADSGTLCCPDDTFDALALLHSPLLDAKYGINHVVFITLDVIICMKKRDTSD